MANPHNPNLPAPLEDVAVQYMLEAMNSLGYMQDASVLLYGKTYLKATYRGLAAFLLDHLRVDINNDPLNPQYVYPAIIDVDDAYLNSDDI